MSEISACSCGAPPGAVCEKLDCRMLPKPDLNVSEMLRLGAEAVSELERIASRSTVMLVAKMLDSDAYSTFANEHIKWCAGYQMRLDRDCMDWRDHTYFGQQFAQRRREAERRAAEIISVVMEPAHVRGGAI